MNEATRERYELGRSYVLALVLLSVSVSLINLYRIMSALKFNFQLMAQPPASQLIVGAILGLVISSVGFIFLYRGYNGVRIAFILLYLFGLYIDISQATGFAFLLALAVNGTRIALLIAPNLRFYIETKAKERQDSGM